MASKKEPLSVTHPELAAQADGWDPTTATQGLSKSVQWRCELGHTWNTSVRHRVFGSKCPTCSNKKVLPGLNDLATTHPELAAQADGWDPTTVSAGSNTKKQWRCGLGHTWNTSVNHRQSGTGCPTCSNKKVLPGFNDLATTNPELAAQADGWDPTTVSGSSHAKRNWRCELGHQWVAVVYSRTFGRGCPFCSGNSVLVGFNDLASTFPELAAQADGWDPTTVTSKSGKKVKWKCSKSHEWNAIIGNRIKGVGCPICSGRDVLIHVNDLATTHPELAAQADGWDPTTLKAHSAKKVKWKCPNGHVWTAALYSRASGYGCPSCAATGFDPNQNGYLYLIDNDVLEMIQIGISNTPKTRLAQHLKRDWEVIEVRGPMEGHLAQQLETAILHAAERRGAVLGHKADIEKFDGYTEAWTKDSLKVTSFKQLLDWVYEDDQ